MSQGCIHRHLGSTKYLSVCSSQASQWQWHFCFGSCWTLQEIAQPQENVSLSFLLPHMQPWIEGRREGWVFVFMYCSSRNHFFNVSLMKLKEFPVGWTGTVKPQWQMKTPRLIFQWALKLHVLVFHSETDKNSVPEFIPLYAYCCRWLWHLAFWFCLSNVLCASSCGVVVSDSQRKVILRDVDNGSFWWSLLFREENKLANIQISHSNIAV